MGDLLDSSNWTVKSNTNKSIFNETVVNKSVLGLDEYGSDEALADVELFAGYPEALLKFAFLCCGICMMVGIPGNLITVVALARCKKVRNATAIFIINLSCADFLFCVFNLPLAASTFWHKSWAHGRLLCKVFSLAGTVLIAVSLFTVLAITINRYVMIARPRLYPRLYTKTNLAIMIVTLWVFSFSALIATWLDKWGRFSLNPKVGSCTIVPDINDRSPKKVISIVVFLVPGLAIIIVYAQIYIIVRKSARKSRLTITMRPKTKTLPKETTVLTADLISENRTNHISPPTRRIPHKNFNCLAIPEMSSTSGMETDDREKRITEGNKFLSRSSEAIQKLKVTFTPAPRLPRSPKLLPSKKDRKLRTMIMAIVMSFGLCHLPISLTRIFLEFTTHPCVNIACYILFYLPTCINPVIYVVMSNEYRQAYRNLWTCKRVK